MLVKSSKVVVFDTELTCWEGKDNLYKSREVISMGACILDVETLEIKDKFYMLSKPVRSEISEYCTNLTGITKEQAENANSFEHMCKSIMKDLDTKSHVSAAWGVDNEQMYYECRNKDCKYPFSSEFVNISLLYSLFMSKPINNGLEKSLVEIGMTFTGEKHDPYWDAYNAALILKFLLERFRK
jgi:inhibitor of KinA sporulation pathway (predicted exonuclease)